MASPEQRERYRDDFLVALYDLSGGDITQWRTNSQVGETARHSRGQIMTITRFLEELRLLEVHAPTADEETIHVVLEDHRVQILAFVLNTVRYGDSETARPPPEIATRHGRRLP